MDRRVRVYVTAAICYDGSETRPDLWHAHQSCNYKASNLHTAGIGGQGSRKAPVLSQGRAVGLGPCQQGLGLGQPVSMGLSAGVYGPLLYLLQAVQNVVDRTLQQWQYTDVHHLEVRPDLSA